MNYVKTFESFSFYDKSWEDVLPDTMCVIKGGETHKFKKGNIMLNADMIQILYNNEDYGSPNTLEFDIYFSFNNNDNKIKLDIDITYGDLVVSEFGIEPPNKINIIQYTSYRSKFDTSNTVFALDESSLNGFIKYLNCFGRGINLKRSDFNFLDKNDNYDPESINESFSISDICQDLKDEFDNVTIFQSGKEKGRAIIRIKVNRKKNYGEMYEMLVEVVDRLEDINLYLVGVYFVSGAIRKYVSLPKVDEIYKHSLEISKVYPEYVNLEFGKTKRNDELTTIVGKFLDRFRDKNQTKYTTYTDNVGPG